jgi:serine/threonine protein phosphatase PrpC
MTGRPSRARPTPHCLRRARHDHITEDDLKEGPKRFPDPQEWADYLVNLALERGSRDNVTCVLVAFARE